MPEVTRILLQIESGDSSAAEQLLPLLYDELRKLAARKLAKEKPGQTLQATALVHEAFLRLVQNGEEQSWGSRGHFFGAAAEAMRRVLIDKARRKNSQRAGGDRKRIELSVFDPADSQKPLDLVSLDEALVHLEAHDSRAAHVVKLRYFAGLTVPQVAKALGVSVSTTENDWAYARTWLKRQMRDAD